MKGFSFSGSERNRMFLNREGEFQDVSLTSGVDFLEDGRGFAVADFNKDGRLDLGIISNQKPRFRIAQLNTAHPSSDDSAEKYVKVRLVGGNHTNKANPKLSPRDPVGATLIAKTGNSTRMFQLSIGDGFSAQNSRTVHIGLGEAPQIDELTIHWPSGRTTAKTGIMVGSKVEIFETEN